LFVKLLHSNGCCIAAFLAIIAQHWVYMLQYAIKLYSDFRGKSLGKRLAAYLDYKTLVDLGTIFQEISISCAPACMVYCINC
jgi:hypothetical protein